MQPQPQGSAKTKHLAFMDDQSAALLLNTPKGARLLLWLMTLVVLSALGWASWAQIDQATTGIGKVIPSSQVKVIQNLEGGVLDAIHIQEGDSVEAGQVLLRIDDTRFLSDFREHNQQMVNLTAMTARLSALLASVSVNENATEQWQHQVKISTQALNFDDDFVQNHPELAERQQAQYHQQLQNLQSQLSVLAQKVKQKQQDLIELKARLTNLKRSHQYALRELNITQPLADEGVVPQIELLQLRRQVNDARRELTSNQLKVPTLESAILEAKLARIDSANAFRAEHQKRLNQLQDQLATLQQSSSTYQDRVNRTQVVSPVKGQVKTIHINTLGGVIQPGMDLVEIVPTEERLVVEAKIAPRDIAFLRPGLAARVRVSAYDFTEFGAIEGTLTHISADTILDENNQHVYLVRITTSNEWLMERPNISIIPGMTASVDILTGKRTVMQYLLQPIIKTHKNAFKE